MSHMEQGKRSRRARRSFTDEFKAEVVKVVLDEGKTVAEVSRDLDLTPSGVGEWVELWQPRQPPFHRLWQPRQPPFRLGPIDRDPSSRTTAAWVPHLRTTRLASAAWTGPG